MKKMVKIVLITFLVAIAAWGTYGKTNLPPLGFALEAATGKTEFCIESGNGLPSNLADAIYCKGSVSPSATADPDPGGFETINPACMHDFPVNFLFNVIQMNDENTKPEKCSAVPTVEAML